jgi:hypothetical protein
MQQAEPAEILPFPQSDQQPGQPLEPVAGVASFWRVEKGTGGGEPLPYIGRRKFYGILA